MVKFLLDCQNTYKDLKLDVLDKYQASNSDCQNTYKDLKLVRTTEAGYTGSNCQNTYKDLKRGKVDLTDLMDEYIVRIPIRT